MNTKKTTTKASTIHPTSTFMGLDWSGCPGSFIRGPQKIIFLGYLSLISISKIAMTHLNNGQWKVMAGITSSIKPCSMRSEDFYLEIFYDGHISNKLCLFAVFFIHEVNEKRFEEAPYETR